MPFDCTGSNRLRRPRLLVRAARAGMAQYRRDRDLTGLLKRAAPGRDLIETLKMAEVACEEARLASAPNYSPTRHVKLLIALLAEARAAVMA
jgi:hypothetical protein